MSRKKKETKKDFMQGEAPTVAPQAPSNLDLDKLKRRAECSFSDEMVVSCGDVFDLIDLAIKGRGYDELEKERDNLQNELDATESKLAEVQSERDKLQDTLDDLQEEADERREEFAR